MMPDELTPNREWTQTVHLNGSAWEITLSRQVRDATPASEPDPDWTHTDKAGHVHRYDVRLGKFLTPTLKWHMEIEHDEDGETYDAGYFVCRKCGERVNPGTRRPRMTKHAYGPWSCVGEVRLSGKAPIPSPADTIALTILIGDAGLTGTVRVTGTSAIYTAGAHASAVVYFAGSPVEVDAKKVQRIGKSRHRPRLASKP